MISEAADPGQPQTDGLWPSPEGGWSGSEPPSGETDSLEFWTRGSLTSEL